MHPVEVLLLPLGWALRNRRPDPATGLANSPALASPHRIALGSPAFGEGEVIPAKHCGPFIGPEISPALTWDALPAGTAELLLIFDDLDNPLGPEPGIHTVAAFPPVEGGLAEGALTPGYPGIRFLPNRRGQSKYVGPRPLPGHGTHRYRFHLFALDASVDLAGLPESAEGHVLAAGVLGGTRTC